MILDLEKSPQKLVPILLMVGLSVASVPTEADTVPDQAPDQLTTAYGVWISSLETRADNSQWVFPFNAPRLDVLSAKDMKTVLSMRRLVQGREMEQLSSQIEIVARRQEEIPVQMLFWLAYAQGTLHRNEACWANLWLLLLAPEAHELLETGQRAWVLTAFADYCFLLEKRERAFQLYGQLAASSVEQLNLWGQYQLAGLEFLNRNFTDANRRYEVVCESEKSGTWREHACAMAEIAGRLKSFDLKGEAHGHVAIVSP